MTLLCRTGVPGRCLEAVVWAFGWSAGALELSCAGGDPGLGVDEDSLSAEIKKFKSKNGIVSVVLVVATAVSAA